MQNFGSPRRYLRSLIDLPVLSAIRTLLALKAARQQGDLVKRWSRRLGISPLDVAEMRSNLPDGDTLFVLGSGDSVEAMTDSQWDEIRQNTSIGINAWPLHPFTSDIYAFEPFDELSTDFEQLFSTVLHAERFASRLPWLLLFRPHTELDAKRYRTIPNNLRTNARLYGRFVPLTRQRQDLDKEIRSLHRWRRKARFHPSLVMDLGATVVRMVSLGFLLGYRKIVLVGVDLNGSAYFWQKNPDRLAAAGIKSFSPGHERTIHETMTRETKAFVVTEVLEAFAHVLRADGVCLMAGSKSSRLAEFLPVYNWQS